MKTRSITLSLILLTGSTTASAATGWEQVGSYIQQACNVASNGDGGYWGGSSKLEWVCNLASTYGFLTNNILNGDWEAFAKEVIGKYSTQLVDHLGEKLGMTQLNKITADINDSMQQSYSDFRSTLMGAMTAALRQEMAGARKDDNAGMAITTPGGLADHAVRSNAYLTLAQTVGRAQETADLFAQLTQAAQAKKVAEQNAESTQAAMKPALESAVSVIGTPVTPGYADQQDAKAKTALSAREVQELQLNSFNAFMKQDAAFRVTEFQLLTEIAKQQAMTNTQLIAKLGDAQAAMDETVNAMKAEMEQVAQENLDAAAQLSREYAILINSFKDLTDADKLQDAKNTYSGKL